MKPYRINDRKMGDGRREGPYYGYALKRVMETPPDSLIERNVARAWRWVACLVILVAIGIAALIVTWEPL